MQLSHGKLCLKSQFLPISHGKLLIAFYFTLYLISGTLKKKKMVPSLGILKIVLLIYIIKLSFMHLLV